MVKPPVTPVADSRGFTTDRNDPDLGHGSNDEPVPPNRKYLVLSDEERAKGFVRPVRRSYVHVGPPGPVFPLRDLTEDEQERYNKDNREPYVKYEPYPEDYRGSALGNLWTQAKLDAVGNGCGVQTTMHQVLAETYARDPHFYGATYCVGCQKHLDVNEFVWVAAPDETGDWKDAQGLPTDVTDIRLGT